MNFAEELKQMEIKKTIQHAQEMALDLNTKLIESAEKGYTGYNISLEGRDDAHILKKDLFIKNLEANLEGCKVTLEKTEHTDLLFKRKFYKKFIQILWK